MTYPIRLETREDIYRFSELASKEDFALYISTSADMFDARSLLVLYTVLGKDVTLVAPDHADSTKFLKFIEKFLNKPAN